MTSHQLAREDEQFLLGHLTRWDREMLWGDRVPGEVEPAALQGMEGTQVRLWGKLHEDQGNKRVCGRSAVVRKGAVEVLTKANWAFRLQAGDLVDEDRQCLKNWLARSEREVLWAELVVDEE